MVFLGKANWQSWVRIYVSITFVGVEPFYKKVGENSEESGAEIIIFI